MNTSPNMLEKVKAALAGVEGLQLDTGAALKGAVEYSWQPFGFRDARCGASISSSTDGLMVNIRVEGSRSSADEAIELFVEIMQRLDGE